VLAELILVEVKFRVKNLGSRHWKNVTQDHTITWTISYGDSGSWISSLSFS